MITKDKTPVAESGGWIKNRIKPEQVEKYLDRGRQFIDEAAIERAYEGVKAVSFEGMQYRKDIGQKALARLRAAKNER